MHNTRGGRIRWRPTTVCKVLVCGGRDFNNVAFILTRLDQFHAERMVTEIITGGCRGVDAIALDWARTKPGIKRYVCKAEWGKYGSAAGPKRNARMLEWKPDIVIAFPGGAGTADMVGKARAAGVEVYEIVIV